MTFRARRKRQTPVRRSFAVIRKKAACRGSGGDATDIFYRKSGGRSKRRATLSCRSSSCAQGRRNVGKARAWRNASAERTENAAASPQNAAFPASRFPAIPSAFPPRPSRFFAPLGPLILSARLFAPRVGRALQKLLAPSSRHPSARSLAGSLAPRRFASASIFPPFRSCGRCFSPRPAPRLRAAPPVHPAVPRRGQKSPRTPKKKRTRTEKAMFLNGYMSIRKPAA